MNFVLYIHKEFMQSNKKYVQLIRIVIFYPLSDSVFLLFVILYVFLGGGGGGDLMVVDFR